VRRTPAALRALPDGAPRAIGRGDLPAPLAGLLSDRPPPRTRKPSMIVVMKPSATAQEIGEVIRRVEAAGFQVHSSKDEGHTVMAVVGSGVEAQRDGLMGLNGVENVFDIVPPYKLASREYRRTSTVVEVGGVKIGGPVPVLIAGPCAVESFDQLLATAEAVKSAGAVLLRGGAFKPRTSPYTFRGLGAEGLKMLH